MMQRYETKPQQEPEYPFTGPYSQDVVAVGAAACGPNYFYGANMENGSCPNQTLEVIPNGAVSLDQFQLV
jgi:hypothetical protein